MVKKISIIVLSLITYLSIYYATYTPPLPDNHGNVDSQLFLGESEKQPLIVAFGGSEGGIGYSGEYMRTFREEILSMGFAFLSIGYFGTRNTQSVLDRISLDAIYDTIQSYKKHPRINGQKIAILGASRGGELVLNLASMYKDFDAVIAIVPSNLSFAYTFNNFGLGETSPWTIDGKEIPYISSTFKTRKILQKDGFYQLVVETLKNDKAVKKAEIPVENINCPILIVSAKNDKIWPSTNMSNLITQRLKDNNFEYYYKHLAIDGGHRDPHRNYNMILDFLNEHFIQE